MQFNSYIFILVFVPFLIIGYFGLDQINAFLGKLYLIAASALFYIYSSYNIAIILCISIIVNYVLALLINRLRTGIYRRFFFISSVFGNVAILFYFKYFDFFIVCIMGLKPSP